MCTCGWAPFAAPQPRSASTRRRPARYRVRMDPVETFNALRPHLFAVAYRMLGSAMDADDAVQEAFLRWQGAANDEVQSPKSFLTTVVIRLCLDQWRSAQYQRETYVGPWLPE